MLRMPVSDAEVVAAFIFHGEPRGQWFRRLLNSVSL